MKAVFRWFRRSNGPGRGVARPLPYTFSTPVHAGPVPKALNSFSLWVGLMVALTVVNYGFPIAQLAMIPETSVPVVPVGGAR